MKYILTLIAVAVSFTFGACCSKQSQCTKSAEKCHGKPVEKCCTKDAAVKKK